MRCSGLTLLKMLQDRASSIPPMVVFIFVLLKGKNADEKELKHDFHQYVDRTRDLKVVQVQHYY